jgi:ribosome-associated protein
MAKTRAPRTRATKATKATKAKTTTTRTASAARSAKGATTRTPKLPKAIAVAVQAVLEKQAEDLVVLDLRKADAFTDFFVICTARNARQIGAIADSVLASLKDTLGERPTLTEGAEKSEWVLLDYFDFIVHVFSRECREFYGLERLWGNATRHELGDAVSVRPSPTS